MELLRCLEKEKGITVYPASCVKCAEGELAMVCAAGEMYLAVSGALQERFCGEACGAYKLCPADHENRLALHEVLDWTRPVALGSEGCSFGFGDRLGFANASQVRAAARAGVRPVLAQQSLRELQLTGRNRSEVLDCASWAVFREGYRGGYGFDGDHLKTLQEVQQAVADGCSMITVDCSLVMGRGAAQQTADDAAYLASAEAEALGLQYSGALLAQLHGVYDAPIALCREIWQQAIVPAGRQIDLEVSLDETEETTTPEAHYFVARELQRCGVAVTSMAPRFVGEFQKAVEYRGDVAELRRTMKLHAAIADRFGYKLSLHSASEKFVALPVLMEATGGRCHIKTSGTSWLEVVEAISKGDAALYRRVHAAALEGIEEARHHYVVHCDLANVPALETVTDERLPDYLLQDDSRQLLHITYGHILGIPELKRDILRFLKENRALYEAEAEELYGRHFAAMYGKR